MCAIELFYVYHVSWCVLSCVIVVILLCYCCVTVVLSGWRQDTLAEWSRRVHHQPGVAPPVPLRNYRVLNILLRTALIHPTLWRISIITSSRYVWNKRVRGGIFQIDSLDYGFLHHDIHIRGSPSCRVNTLNSPPNPTREIRPRIQNGKLAPESNTAKLAPESQNAKLTPREFTKYGVCVLSLLI